jgi:hypothetical protein
MRIRAPSGSLNQYTASRNGKTYPSIKGDRDPDKLEHWNWNYSYKVKSPEGDRWCKTITKSVRSTIKKDLAALYQSMDEITVPRQQTAAAEAFELITNASEASKQAQKQAIYFSECDRLHHLQICREIVALLGTASGNYALERILKSTLHFIVAATGQEPVIIKESYKIAEIALMVTAIISGTHWIEAISRKQSEIN